MFRASLRPSSGGQTAFSLSQSSVCMNQENEIKHLDAPNTFRASLRPSSGGQTAFSLSQSSVCINQENEIKHLDAPNMFRDY